MKIWPNLHSNLKVYWIPAIALRNIDLWSCHFRLIFAAYVVKVLQDIYYLMISSLKKGFPRALEWFHWPNWGSLLHTLRDPPLLAIRPLLFNLWSSYALNVIAAKIMTRLAMKIHENGILKSSGPGEIISLLNAIQNIDFLLLSYLI